MKKIYQAPKSEQMYVEALMQETVGSPVNDQGGEAPQRGGDFMPL